MKEVTLFCLLYAVVSNTGCKSAAVVDTSSTSLSRFKRFSSSFFPLLKHLQALSSIFSHQRFTASILVSDKRRMSDGGE